jgi:hypothetical protein
MRKMGKIINEDNLFPGRGSNLRYPEYEYGVITIVSQLSIILLRPWVRTYNTFEDRKRTMHPQLRTLVQATLFLGTG